MSTPITSRLSRLTKSVIDLVLPVYCIGCNREGNFLCDKCSGLLLELEPPFCDICADPGASKICENCRLSNRFSPDRLQGIRAPYLMEGKVREAVHRFKYRNYRVAAPTLASLMAKYLENNPLPGEVLVPVPLHPRKLRERGYNQAGLMAKELGKLTGLPVEDRLLTRTRYTPPQARAGDGQQRSLNTADAFVYQGKPSGNRFILVDDVCTTGSTLGACASALTDAGASSVWALVFARERLRNPGGGP